MSDPNRALNYTIELFERTVERVQQELRYENAQVRQAYTGEITRLGVDLLELTRKVDAMVALLTAANSRLGLLEQSVGSMQRRVAVATWLTAALLLAVGVLAGMVMRYG